MAEFQAFTSPSSVLVTGGTRGIGRAVVEALSKEGILVFAGCRNRADGDALAASLASENGVSGVLPVQLDVTDPASVAAAVEDVKGKLQTLEPLVTLDAIVNNAGVLLEREGTPLADVVEDTLRVNFDGVVSVTEAFLPLVSDGAHVVHVSSNSGARVHGKLSSETRAAVDAAPGTAALRELFTLLSREAAATGTVEATPIYGMSKCALNAYTRLSAGEAPRRIRVNACSPGFCRTDIAGATTYTREPKDAALGATVIIKLLLGELAPDATGRFFKEVSAPGTPLERSKSREEPWMC
mmetsp:Transcript_20286/g.62503  ORF Transcript_20286/g.62503 Transcript_20286/m.62503 type:complete len:297 (+) Transcript_20286:285-1175(+)